LVDLLLPKTDGISIVKKIKKIDKKISFIMISEVNNKEMISKAYSAGIEYYINKPVNIIESIEIINRVKQKIKNIDLINSFKNIENYEMGAYKKIIVVVVKIIVLVIIIVIILIKLLKN
jgi:two-component system response regulator YcbB